MNRVLKTACVWVFAGAALSVPLATGAAYAQAAADATVAAQSPITLTSEAQIERIELDATGKEKSVLFDPKNVIIVPGDNVVFTLNVNNSGAVAAAGFRATNPIPEPVAFVAVSEDWAEVSVDGGATWGKLASLMVKAKAADTGVEQTRTAAPEDVTHVRWVFTDAIAANSKRSVSYRGVVK